MSNQLDLYLTFPFDPTTFSFIESFRMTKVARYTNVWYKTFSRILNLILVDIYECINQSSYYTNAN